MKLRYMFLLLLAFVFVPGTKSFATETETVEVYDPDNVKNFNDFHIKPEDEQLVFDTQGHVIKGVIYVRKTNILFKYVVTSSELSPLCITFEQPSDYYPQLYSVGSIVEGFRLAYYDCTNLPDERFVCEDEYIWPLSDDYDFTLYNNGINEKIADNSYFREFLSGDDVTSFYTNIPIFQDKDGEAFKNYIENGDYSGASNASDVDEAKKAIYPDNKYENEKGPWLKMKDFFGSGLTIRPASNASCQFTFEPQNTDIYTDVTMVVLYEYRISWEVASNADLGGSHTVYANEEIPLSIVDNKLDVYPAKVLDASGDSWWSTFTTRECIFGGRITGGMPGVASTDLLEITGSYLTVTMKLKGKYKGDWVHGGAALEEVDLLERTCTEKYAYSDDQGNYTVDDSTEAITRDENGDVVINNNVSGGGGGSSSSATGGNANVTIGDITSSSTFRFPDKMTIDLNIKGLEGTGGGGSSGSSEESDKKWYDRLLDAIGSLIEFLTEVVTKLFEALGDLLTTFADSVGDFIQYLFEGFGLFKNDGGIGSLIQDNYSFVPSEVWRLVMFGIASVILVSIVNRFFK